jgi:hypothetical protein
VTFIIDGFNCGVGVDAIRAALDAFERGGRSHRVCSVHCNEAHDLSRRLSEKLAATYQEDFVRVSTDTPLLALVEDVVQEIPVTDPDHTLVIMVALGGDVAFEASDRDCIAAAWRHRPELRVIQLFFAPELHPANEWLVKALPNPVMLRSGAYNLPLRNWLLYRSCQSFPILHPACVAAPPLHRGVANCADGSVAAHKFVAQSPSLLRDAIVAAAAFSVADLSPQQQGALDIMREPGAASSTGPGKLRPWNKFFEWVCPPSWPLAGMASSAVTCVGAMNVLNGGPAGAGSRSVSCGDGRYCRVCMGVYESVCEAVPGALALSAIWSRFVYMSNDRRELLSQAQPADLPGVLERGGG